MATTIRGYKVFNSDFTCRNHQFSENSEHQVEGKPELCSNGFHFCPKANDCFEYYSFNANNIVCEVEALGDVDGLDSDGNPKENKLCTNQIRIGRRLSWHEVLNVVNSGVGNTGRGNAGDMNTGNMNTGYWNTGDRNTGNRNTGYWNTGNRNTGNMNTGDMNTGNMNTGNRNTGNMNTGNRNTGNRNTGDMNTGNRNTGYWNTASDSSGVFCTEDKEILMFNKPSGMTMSQWMDTEAFHLRTEVLLTEWRSWSDMTSEEKEQYPRAETQDGYLKRHEYKQAHATWWKALDKRQREQFTDLPNFDAAVFEEITGIDVNADVVAD